MQVRGNIDIRGSLEGFHRIAHFRDEKAFGNHGGNLTNAAWNTRTLNTVIRNDLGAGLSSNQITLAAGSYYIEAFVTNKAVDDIRARIQNITSGTTLLVGLSVRNSSTEDYGLVIPVRGLITLSVQSVIELQNFLSSGANSLIEGGHALGVSGVNEVYSEIIISSY